MKRWILIAAIVLLQPIGIAEARGPDSVRCRVPRAPRRAKWKLKSVQMEIPSSLRCREMVAATRRTLRSVTPSSRRAVRRLGRTEFHVWLEDASTPGQIRFEARAWAVSSSGRHLRHVTRAVAAASGPVGRRERIAPRLARLALNRALRDLASEVRRPQVASRGTARRPLAFR